MDCRIRWYCSAHTNNLKYGRIECFSTNSSTVSICNGRHLISLCNLLGKEVLRLERRQPSSSVSVSPALWWPDRMWYLEAIPKMLSSGTAGSPGGVVGLGSRGFSSGYRVLFSPSITEIEPFMVNHPFIYQFLVGIVRICDSP